jgi:hypothetical protein
MQWNERVIGKLGGMNETKMGRKALLGAFYPVPCYVLEGGDHARVEARLVMNTAFGRDEPARKARA